MTLYILNEINLWDFHFSFWRKVCWRVFASDGSGRVRSEFRYFSHIFRDRGGMYWRHFSRFACNAHKSFTVSPNIQRVANEMTLRRFLTSHTAHNNNPNNKHVITCTSFTRSQLRSDPVRTAFFHISQNHLSRWTGIVARQWKFKSVSVHNFIIKIIVLYTSAWDFAFTIPSSLRSDVPHHSNADAVVDVGRSCCYLRNLRVADFPAAICVAHHHIRPAHIRRHRYGIKSVHTVGIIRDGFIMHVLHFTCSDAGYSFVKRIACCCRLFLFSSFSRLCERNNGRGSNAVEHGFGCLRTIGRKQERENENTSVRTISFQLKR